MKLPRSVNEEPTVSIMSVESLEEQHGDLTVFAKK